MIFFHVCMSCSQVWVLRLHLHCTDTKPINEHNQNPYFPGAHTLISLPVLIKFLFSSLGTKFPTWSHSCSTLICQCYCSVCMVNERRGLVMTLIRHGPGVRDRGKCWMVKDMTAPSNYTIVILSCLCQSRPGQERLCMTVQRFLGQLDKD